ALAGPGAGRAERTARGPQGPRVALDPAGRLARRDGDPRRGRAPGAAARPDLPARAGRGADDAGMSGAKADLKVLDDPGAEAAVVLARHAAAGHHIALAGGSTPRGAYQRLADMRLDWSQSTLWWG